METKTYKILNRISCGLNNEGWGMVKDFNTKDMFGSIESIDVKGEYIYLYKRVDECSEEEMEPDLRVTVSDEYAGDLYILLYKLGS